VPLRHIRPLDEKALEVLQPALAIWQELKDKKNEGETLDNIGGNTARLRFFVVISGM
jgi:hypothetical protein